MWVSIAIDGRADGRPRRPMSVPATVRRWRATRWAVAVASGPTRACGGCVPSAQIFLDRQFNEPASGGCENQRMLPWQQNSPAVTWLNYSALHAVGKPAMRVTAGADVGAKLRAPRGATTRPTGAKVREAIFNILGPPPPHPVLDLFAGTGSLGSRPLRVARWRPTSWNANARALGTLHRNLRELGSLDGLVSRRECAARPATHGWCGRGQGLWLGLRGPALRRPMKRNPVLALLAGKRTFCPRAPVIIVEHGRRSSAGRGFRHSGHDPTGASM